MKDLAAWILAGGKSSRMGKDKALLAIAGKPLIVRAIELALQITDPVAIVGDPAKFAAYAPVISDVFSGCGPLAGIHAALKASNSELNLMLAVDLPFLNAPLLSYIANQAQSSGAMVTVPSTGKHLHPLCGVYRKQFAGVAEKALRSGKYKIDALFDEVKVRMITEEELKANRFAASLLRNVNSPQEWEQVEREYASAD